MAAPRSPALPLGGCHGLARSQRRTPPLLDNGWPSAPAFRVRHTGTPERSRGVWVSNARVQRPAEARSIRARVAAIAAALLLAGALAAAATVAARASGTGADSHVQLSLGYACSFPTGTQQARMHVGVTIAATFPGDATAGPRIQPTGVQITVRLPSPAVDALRESGATAVSTTALLSVEASQRTTTMTTRWQGQSVTTQSLPSAGDISVVAPGRAAPVTASSGGTVTFTSADLSLALIPASATGTSAASASPSPGSGGSGGVADVSPSPGSEASASPGSSSPVPTELRVACTPASHRGTVLNAIPVASASSKPHPKSPAGRHKLKLPKGCGHIKVVGSGTAVCGYITGYSDVAKLYGAALLQPKRPARPALVNIDFAYRHFLKPGKLIALSTGELDYQGHRQLPPVRTTFLAFRLTRDRNAHGHGTDADQDPLRFWHHGTALSDHRPRDHKGENPDLGRRCQRRAAGDRAALQASQFAATDTGRERR